MRTRRPRTQEDVQKSGMLPATPTCDRERRKKEDRPKSSQAKRQGAGATHSGETTRESWAGSSGYHRPGTESRLRSAMIAVWGQAMPLAFRFASGEKAYSGKLPKKRVHPKSGVVRRSGLQDSVQFPRGSLKLAPIFGMPQEKTTGCSGSYALLR